MHPSRSFSLPAAGLLVALLPAALPAVTTEEIIVTTTREAVLRAETPASVTVVNQATLDLVRPAHPSEILNRVPGVSVQQTNGEGHITGIRQPISTNPVYLYLEDGVPVRATGFFNHNAMYEVNLPQSGGMEVIRGPGTALQGSDAIGGVVNVLTRAPSATPEAAMTLEAGSDTWLRGLFSASNTWGAFAGRADLNITHSDGWRDESGYDRQSITLRGDNKLSDTSRLKTVLAASNIDQDTGALSFLSETDYRTNPTRNYTPIAYRKVKTVRLSTDFERDTGSGLASAVPYVRWSELELLPTFTLNFDPAIWTTAYYSVGALLKYRHDMEPWRTRIITGVDLDYSPGYREEDRIVTVRDGPVYVDYTVTGRLYDYDVDFWQTSPYVQVETSPVERLRLTAGLRYDVMGYRYDNKLEDGPFTTLTPFGPRTFYRPADDSLRWDRFSPSLGATWAFSGYLNGFVSYKNSFRVPQEGQLFRSGANVSSLELKPVKADSYEAGLRGGSGTALFWELSAYRLTKDDDVLTINTGEGPTLTNNGKTRHKGVEAAIGWNFHPEWRAELSGTIAEHEFVNWVTVVNNVPTDFSGKEQSLAPESIGSVVLAYMPGWAPGLDLEAEWSHLGSYWLDDANTARYSGHDLVNLRANYALRQNTQLFLRLTNLFDTRWATAGRVNAGNPEFAPGQEFSLYAGLSQRF